MGEPLRGPVVVTGTDTGVGKTIVTAAIAASATARGLSVAVLKPAQTGVEAFDEGEQPDEATVAWLAGPATTRTLASYPDPLAPLTAARVSGRPPLALPEVLSAVASLVSSHDVVLIEGAGGLLVQMGPSWTIGDLAGALACTAVVVTRAGLGTLNHTALTLEALERRSIASYVVIGAWPSTPELVHRTNLTDLGRVHGVLPDGAGRLSPPAFRASAPGWLAPQLHGTGADLMQYEREHL
jgi:dethiobiotin synthetase